MEVPGAGVLATGALGRLLGEGACFAPGALPEAAEGAGDPAAGEEAALASGEAAEGVAFEGSAGAELIPSGACAAVGVSAGGADVSGALMSLCTQAATMRRIGTEAIPSRCIRRSVAFAR